MMIIGNFLALPLSILNKNYCEVLDFLQQIKTDHLTFEKGVVQVRKFLFHCLIISYKCVGISRA